MALTAELPIWLAPGVKPGTELYTNGWGDKEYPSAEVFNFLQNRAYLALKELQEQMPDNTNITDLLNKKVDKVEGMGLSEKNFTAAEKNKLSAIESEANKYVLPAATSSTLGGVKVAVNTGIEVTTGGTISATTLKESVDDHLIDSLSHVFYCGTSSGVNAKVISNTAVKSYVEGLQVKFKNSDSNTGNVTVNINGLGTKKLLTFTGEEIASAELRANMVYNIVYNGTDFFLASGGVNTGDATALSNDILSGKTAYVDGQKVTGTMTNRGAVTEYIAPNDTIIIPEGYHNGNGKVIQQVNTKGAETFIPTTKDQQILVGQLLVGTQTIKGDANLVSANIVSGKSIFGVNGSTEKAVKPMSKALLDIVGTKFGYKLSSVDSDSNYYFTTSTNSSAAEFVKYSYNGTLLERRVMNLTPANGSEGILLGYTKYGYCYCSNGIFIVEDTEKTRVHSEKADGTSNVAPPPYLRSAWCLGNSELIIPYGYTGIRSAIYRNFNSFSFDLDLLEQTTAFLNSKDELVYHSDNSYDDIYVVNVKLRQKTSVSNTKVALGSFSL